MCCSLAWRPSCRRSSPPLNGASRSVASPLSLRESLVAPRLAARPRVRCPIPRITECSRPFQPIQPAPSGRGTRTPTVLLPPAPQAGGFAVLPRTGANPADGSLAGASCSARLRDFIRTHSHTLLLLEEWAGPLFAELVAGAGHFVSGGIMNGAMSPHVSIDRDASRRSVGGITSSGWRYLVQYFATTLVRRATSTCWWSFSRATCPASSS